MKCHSGLWNLIDSLERHKQSPEEIGVDGDIILKYTSIIED
jgi:hypothetical protein